VNKRVLKATISQNQLIHERLLRIRAWERIYDQEGMRWGREPSLSARFFCEAIEPQTLPNGLILDVGCGYGRDLVKFWRHFPGREILGVEVAPSAKALWLEILDELPAVRGADRPSLAICDFFTLSEYLVPARPVALVHANYVFHLLPFDEMALAVKRLAGLIIPGGYIGFSLVAADDSHCLKDAVDGSVAVETEDGTWTCLSTQGVSQLFDTIGITPVSVVHLTEVEQKRGRNDIVQMWHVIIQIGC